MGFMDYWLEPDDKPKTDAPASTAVKTQPVVESAPVTKFPSKETTQTVVVGATNCEPHMEAVMALYEKGFEGLNKPGIDFFEYLKSVISAGIDNAQAYPMAFNMLKGLDSTITKDSLLLQSKFYVDEINKVHQGYLQGGDSKKMQIEKEKTGETEKLKTDLQLLKQQFESIQTQIQSKEMLLTNIDAKYNPELENIACKMAANDMAKDKILGTINKVASGLSTNL